MECYYIQNEKQYKQVVLRLCNKYEAQDFMWFFNILGCDYCEDSCCGCSQDECLLLNHSTERDVLSHFDVDEEDVYPFILLALSRPEEGKLIRTISVEDAKYNTKYGFGE